MTKPDAEKKDWLNAPTVRMDGNQVEILPTGDATMAKFREEATQVLAGNPQISLKLALELLTNPDIIPGQKEAILARIKPEEIIDRGRMFHLLAALRNPDLIDKALKKFSYELVRSGGLRVKIPELKMNLGQRENAEELLRELEKVETMELRGRMSGHEIYALIAGITDPNIIAALLSKLGLDLVPSPVKR